VTPQNGQNLSGSLFIALSPHQFNLPPLLAVVAGVFPLARFALVPRPPPAWSQVAVEVAVRFGLVADGAGFHLGSEFDF
jgi:hypothetical protein